MAPRMFHESRLDPPRVKENRSVSSPLASEDVDNSELLCISTNNHSNIWGFWKDDRETWTALYSDQQSLSRFPIWSKKKNRRQRIMNCSVFLPTITQLIPVNIRGFWKQISTKKYSVNCQSSSNVFIIYGREIWTALYFYETLIEFSINILEFQKRPRRTLVCSVLLHTISHSIPMKQKRQTNQLHSLKTNGG